MSNALEIREAPSEMKHYLTHGQALEPFLVALGINIRVSSPPVPLGRCDPTQILGRFVSCRNRVNSQKHGQQPGIRIKSGEHNPNYDPPLWISQRSVSPYTSYTPQVVFLSMSSGRDQLMS